MRVAVISAKDRQVGKTALSLLLANAYPNASKKQSIYTTNKSLNEVLTLQKFTETSVSIEKSINVVTSLSAGSSISDEDLLDYSYRPLSTNAMLFDIYSDTIGYEEAQENFMRIIKRLGHKFIIMDLNGDPYSPEVNGLADECDLILYVFKPTRAEALEARAYLDSLDEDGKLKVKLVCNIWDDHGIKKKSMQELIKIRSNSILWFPYHVNIQRTMFEGRLCILNRLIIEGRDNLISLRQPIKDILSFICDTPNVKVIREVSKWEI